jgi:hypothetical protein
MAALLNNDKNNPATAYAIAAAAPAVTASIHQPADMLGGSPSFSISNRCASSSSLQTAKQPGIAAASNVQCSPKRCSQMPWHDLAHTFTGGPVNAHAVVMDTCQASKQQQQKVEAGLQACMPSCCVSGFDTSSNKELSLLLLWTA